MPSYPPITNYKTPDPERGAVLPHVNDGTAWRALGCLPSPSDMGGLPRLTDSFPLIPRSQWKPISFAGYKVRMMDQGHTGSCVGHGAAGAFQKSWLISGATPHDFSPCFVYALGNGGRDAGMNISTAGEILSRDGICLESEMPEGNIWEQQITAAARATAARFKSARYFHADSFDAIGTGIMLGMIPFYGTYVAGDFGNLDGEGVSPAYPGRTGNHCMHGDGLTHLPSGRWAVENINSWGARWGNNGRCRLVEGHFNRDCDAILIQVLADDPQETNVPPHIADVA